MQATKTYTTPGVYIEEYDAFPPSVVPVATAVPAFVGYTQTAQVDNKPAYFQPIAIGSLADYIQYFGGAFTPLYEFTEALDAHGAPVTTAPIQYDLAITQGTATTWYDLTPTAQYNMFNSLQMFFANGGGNCWVVSVGPYEAAGIGTAANPTTNLTPTNALKQGLLAIQNQYGPTLLVVPDLVLLPPDAVRLAEPGRELVVDLVRCGQPEGVQDVAR